MQKISHIIRLKHFIQNVFFIVCVSFFWGQAAVAQQPGLDLNYRAGIEPTFLEDVRIVESTDEIKIKDEFINSIIFKDQTESIFIPDFMLVNERTGVCKITLKTQDIEQIAIGAQLNPSVAREFVYFHEAGHCLQAGAIVASMRDINKARYYESLGLLFKGQLKEIEGAQGVLANLTPRQAFFTDIDATGKWGKALKREAWADVFSLYTMLQKGRITQDEIKHILLWRLAREKVDLLHSSGEYIKRLIDEISVPTEYNNMDNNMFKEAADKPTKQSAAQVATKIILIQEEIEERNFN